MSDGPTPSDIHEQAAESAQPRGVLLGSFAWAWITGAAALAAAFCLGFALLFDSPRGAAASIDFNGELFADLLGPYWRTALALAAGENTPDPQYLYPATFAVLLKPVTGLGAPGASWTGVVMGALSISLLLGAALLMHRPRRTLHLTLLAAALFLSFPVVHGAYWANAGPLSLGAAAFGWCLAARGREGLGGALIGLGAAIKMLPALLIVGLVMHGRRRAAWAGAASALGLAALLPWLALGTTGFASFHGATFEQLREMASFARTLSGGRGSQDIIAVSARVAGHAAPWWGWAIGALAFLWALAQGVRTRPVDSRVDSRVHLPEDTDGPMDQTLLWFLAAPGLLISPTWAHGLTWLPLVWWWAAPRLQSPRLASFGPGPSGALRSAASWRSGVGWALLLASMALGSLPAAWLTGDPTLYLISGAPLASSLLALGALRIACHAPGRPIGRPIST